MSHKFVELINGRSVERTILDPCEGYIGKSYIDLPVRLEAEIRYWKAQIASEYSTPEFRKVSQEQLDKCLAFNVKAHNVFEPDWFMTH